VLHVSLAGFGDFDQATVDGVHRMAAGIRVPPFGVRFDRTANFGGASVVPCGGPDANFAHLFSMSLLPFSTAWMAASRLAPQPVAFYAAVFFLVNATYLALLWELALIGRAPGNPEAAAARRIMRLRSLATLGLFALAAAVALVHPLVGLGICVCCLIFYLRPDPLFARAGLG
jgi:hypothetical protein